MLRIIKEIPIEKFESWNGAEDNLNIIVENNKENELENYIEECYPDGITENSLNDILIDADGELFEYLNISEDKENEENEGEENEAINDKKNK